MIHKLFIQIYNKGKMRNDRRFEDYLFSICSIYKFFDKNIRTLNNRYFSIIVNSYKQFMNRMN